MTLTHEARSPEAAKRCSRMRRIGLMVKEPGRVIQVRHIPGDPSPNRGALDDSFFWMTVF